MLIFALSELLLVELSLVRFRQLSKPFLHGFLHWLHSGPLHDNETFQWRKVLTHVGRWSPLKKKALARVTSWNFFCCFILVIYPYRPTCTGIFTLSLQVASRAANMPFSIYNCPPHHDPKKGCPSYNLTVKQMLLRTAMPLTVYTTHSYSHGCIHNRIQACQLSLKVRYCTVPL